jgi:hypothetical protein
VAEVTMRVGEVDLVAALTAGSARRMKLRVGEGSSPSSQSPW